MEIDVATVRTVQPRRGQVEIDFSEFLVSFFQLVDYLQLVASELAVLLFLLSIVGLLRLPVESLIDLPLKLASQFLQPTQLYLQYLHFLALHG